MDRRAWMRLTGWRWWLAYVLHEPREAVVVIPQRITCRTLGIHSKSCRGKRSHSGRERRGWRSRGGDWRCVQP